MSLAKKLLLVVAALTVLLIIAAVTAMASFNIDHYRAAIADALAKQAGRAVSLNGPIKLDFSAHGVSVIVQDAAIGNPPWASRPVMAGIGRLELGVALMPLLSKRLEITRLDIANADIQLETGPNDQRNWDMHPAAPAKPASPAKTKPAAASSNVAVQLRELSVQGSQLALRAKGGGMNVFKVDKLSLAPGSRGAALHFTGFYNGAPVKLALDTGAADLMADAKWPYDAALSYGSYSLQAKGAANSGSRIFTADSYSLDTGGFSVHGQMVANLAGARAAIKGTVIADKLDPAALKPPVAGKPGGKQAAQPARDSGRLFSTAPLDLSALKSADAALDISIGELPLGEASLQQISGRLTLAGGNLALAPVKAALGKGEIQGEVHLAAVQPAQYAVSLKASGIDMADLLRLAGAAPFISGKGDADIQLSGSGDSPHEMAASAKGRIIVTAAGGKISSAEAGAIAAGLMQIFAPGTTSPKLDCLAVRFNIENGVAKDNGILADSTASTVAGAGGFNLGEETVDLALNAKPKMGGLVSMGGASNILPSVRVSGPLGSPGFGIDAAGAIQGVAGMLLQGNVTGVVTSSVPDIMAPPAGQNACIYTLDHKPAAQPEQKSGVQNAVGKAGAKVKAIGKQLMQGLFGH